MSNAITVMIKKEISNIENLHLVLPQKFNIEAFKGNIKAIPGHEDEILQVKVINSNLLATCSKD